MPLLAALLRHESDRESLRKATPHHGIVWASSWSELNRVVRRRPVAAVLADLYAESRKDGVLRVYRLGKRYPLTPIVVWGSMDGRDLYRLGKAGASEVLTAREAEDEVLVAETIDGVIDGGLGRRLHQRLRDVIDDEALAFLDFALLVVPDQALVSDLAEGVDVSVSTLERRCAGWGLPSPGRLLLWLRVLHALRWLQEPGRSVESVADQIGYSSGAALRRAIKATLGGEPGPWRSTEGHERAVEMFLAECGAAREHDA